MERTEVLAEIKKFYGSGGQSINGNNMGAMAYDKGEKNDNMLKLHFVYEVMLKGEVDGKERIVVAHGGSNHDLNKGADHTVFSRNSALVQALEEWNA